MGKSEAVRAVPGALGWCWSRRSRGVERAGCSRAPGGTGELAGPSGGARAPAGESRDTRKGSGWRVLGQVQSTPHSLSLAQAFLG